MNRVWTYIIPRPLNEQELGQLKTEGKTFAETWTAHENKLSASFDVFMDRVIIVKVNEEIAGASGCSIDKLTRFLKICGQKLDIDLMDRLQVAFEDSKGVEVVKSTEIPDLLRTGQINGETVVFNTSVANETELQNWKQPLKLTWLKKYLLQA